uniref:Uncharacterized protein n=1 Tax=Picea glauca TaxID=3330 RepID=A0A101LZ34_PICGL|nr:hypothetical protein ABT39_MTgene5009 [Picea glauca]QHR86563.1 hypothetical protein Q903MT_gene566 [Picea sitchensis]
MGAPHTVIQIKMTSLCSPKKATRRVGITSICDPHFIEDFIFVLLMRFCFSMYFLIPN